MASVGIGVFWFISSRRRVLSSLEVDVDVDEVGCGRCHFRLLRTFVLDDVVVQPVCSVFEVSMWP